MNYTWDPDETMRREGYEILVSMPKVIVRDTPEGKLEPYEDVSVDCEDAYSGTVIQELNLRGGELRDMRSDGDHARLEFLIPPVDSSGIVPDF